MNQKPNLNEATNLVTKEDLDVATKRFDLLATGVIIVMFIGFVTIFITGLGLIIDAWRFKAETYQNLVNQVTTQNAKIDTLTNELNIKFK